MSESSQVQAIRARYKHSLPDKVNMVSDLLFALTEPKTDLDEALNNINEDVHKLAGSSGMYGYDDVSNLAREVICHIENREMQQIEASLLELRNLLQQHA